MTKKTLKTYVDSFRIDSDFAGLSLTEFVNKINFNFDKIVKTNPQFSDMHINDCFESEIEIYGTREETDKEYAARIKYESRKTLTKEEKERKEWARLNKKYGNGV